MSCTLPPFPAFAISATCPLLRQPVHRVQRTCLLAGALLALLAGTVSAQPLPQTPQQYLALMDLNGDGRISLAEYRDYMSRRFRAMDRDGDGVLRGDELPVPGTRPVRLADYLESLRQAFLRQDLDGNGYLDVRELASPPR